MLMRIVDLLVLVFFIVPIPLIVFIQGNFYYYWDYFYSISENDPSTQIYDFIVVGAGSGGSVLANRLTKQNRVLLLESGGDPLWHNYIPVFALEMLDRPQVDWMYKTVPQKFSHFSMENQQSHWPRGKVLGGSSVLNYMLYVRGHELDFNNWANITGDSSWNYKNVLPYFKKSLIYKGDYTKNEKQYGSTPYGYLHVEKRNKGPMRDLISDAARELGLENIDLNGPQRSGIGALEATLKKGSRCSTFTAFLEPILTRKNLDIRRYAHVTKIKIDSAGNARGVWFNRHGRKYFASASKEVVISAGAIDSAKLLLLSGIGPKEHLKEVGIKPKVNLPVGKFLKDHIGVLVGPILIDKPITVFPERDIGLSTFLEYFLNGTGHLTYPSLLDMQGFISTSKVKQLYKDWPDIQLYFSYAGLYENLPMDFSRLTGVKKEIIHKYFSKYIGKHGITVGVALVRPKSYGNLRLKNKDPLTPPLLDPRYLEHPDDIKAFVEGIKFLVDFVEKTKSFQSINASFPDVYWPGCEKYKLRSDQYWECYARHYAFTVYHPIGTCRMGKGVQDPLAVVDSQLRVLKVNGLRVADASIMPEIVNGNTNAPTIMIGEKAADMIRQHWSEQYLICDQFHLIFYYKLQQKQCFYSQLV
ncbi:unnamed protein product [Orchesella dallaii]|uniref:Glucose-methanol-choline oxidoreductase N-terminal domain-containing protein n=1 Tax=Orchesella dallaii TaxID=48710 RepID=A0ABP1RNJ4_9HEXA